jgi:hypothetical protein
MLFPCPVPETPLPWYARSRPASPPRLSYDELYNICLERAHLAPGAEIVAASKVESSKKRGGETER